MVWMSRGLANEEASMAQENILDFYGVILHYS